MKIRKLITTVSLAILSACGASEPAVAACSVPHEVVMGRGTDGVMRKYEKATANSPYVLTATGDAAFRSIHTCPGSGTQTLKFKLNTVGFFEYSGATPPQGDHIAALTRATVNLNIPYYQSRGLIFHKDSGILAERFYLNAWDVNAKNIVQCPSYINGGSCYNDGSMQWPMPATHAVTMQDNTVYHAEIESVPTWVQYNTLKTTTGQNAASGWVESYDLIPMNGMDVVFATLCKEDCLQPFTVRIFDITAGWK